MYPGEWRVEWFDDDGSCEVSIFGGPRGVSGGYGRQLPK
jgi:hypothetical protein